MKTELQLKHLAPYLPYGLNYYPSEASDIFDDAFADYGRCSDYNYQMALDAKDEYAIKLKNSFMIPCHPFIAIEDGELFLGQFKSSLGFDIDDVFAREVKPILRPLSDVIKPIKYSKSNYSIASLMWSIDAKEESDFDCYGTIPSYWKSCLHQLKEDVKNIDYGDFIMLVSHHFDVFGLIDKGLAIDINTIQPCQTDL